jgi:hypothetical protein
MGQEFTLGVDEDLGGLVADKQSSASMKSARMS